MRYSEILAREGDHKAPECYSQGQVTGSGKAWKHQGPANCGTAKEKNKREEMIAIAGHLKQVPIPPPNFPTLIVLLFQWMSFHLSFLCCLIYQVSCFALVFINWWHFPYFLPSLTQGGPHVLSLWLLFIGALFDRPITTHCSDGLTIANS